MRRFQEYEIEDDEPGQIAFLDGNFKLHRQYEDEPEEEFDEEDDYFFDCLMESHTYAY